MGGFQISNATIPIAATPNHQISRTRKLVIPGCAVVRFTTNPCRGVIARRNSHSKAGINVLNEDASPDAESKSYHSDALRFGPERLAEIAVVSPSLIAPTPTVDQRQLFVSPGFGGRSHRDSRRAVTAVDLALVDHRSSVADVLERDRAKSTADKVADSRYSEWSTSLIDSVFASNSLEGDMRELTAMERMMDTKTLP
jgi:hypothetical protein